MNSAVLADSDSTIRVKHTLKLVGGRRLKDIVPVPDEGADPLKNRWTVESCEDFEALVRRCVARVCGSAGLPKQILEDVKEDTLDAMTEAFLRTTDLGFKEKRGNKFAALLRGSLPRWCISARRSATAKKRKHGVTVGLAIEPTDRRPDVVDELIQSETVQLIRSRINAIRNRERRTIVMLHLYEQLTFQEIGARLRISTTKAFTIFDEERGKLANLLEGKASQQ